MAKMSNVRCKTTFQAGNRLKCMNLFGDHEGTTFDRQFRSESTKCCSYRASDMLLTTNYYFGHFDLFLQYRIHDALKQKT
jgi:hypothetical protein